MYSYPHHSRQGSVSIRYHRSRSAALLQEYKQFKSMLTIVMSLLLFFCTPM